MPSKRSFYKTTLTVTILSEGPIPDDMGISDMVSDGDYNVDYEIDSAAISSKEMANTLTDQGSKPEFFMLTTAGEDAEE